MYTHDPREAAGLKGDEAELILGGEAALWTETVDAVTLDSLLWPRLGAVAEVLWSGRTDAQGVNRTQFDAAPRLADMRERMVARGVAASPVQMIFCTQNDPSACSM
jgi:hexosaminidase